MKINVPSNVLHVPLATIQYLVNASSYHAPLAIVLIASDPILVLFVIKGSPSMVVHAKHTLPHQTVLNPIVLNVTLLEHVHNAQQVLISIKVTVCVDSRTVYHVWEMDSVNNVHSQPLQPILVLKDVYPLSPSLPFVKLNTVANAKL